MQKGEVKVEALVVSAYLFYSVLSLQLSTLLDLVGFCCEQTPEILALYYDELANLIEKQKGNLDLQLLVYCRVF